MKLTNYHIGEVDEPEAVSQFDVLQAQPSLKAEHCTRGCEGHHLCHVMSYESLLLDGCLLIVQSVVIQDEGAPIVVLALSFARLFPQRMDHVKAYEPLKIVRP